MAIRRNTKKRSLTFGNKQVRDTRVHVPKIVRPDKEEWRKNLPSSGGSGLDGYVLDVMKLS